MDWLKNIGIYFFKKIRLNENYFGQPVLHDQITGFHDNELGTQWKIPVRERVCYLCLWTKDLNTHGFVRKMKILYHKKGDYKL